MSSYSHHRRASHGTTPAHTANRNDLRALAPTLSTTSSSTSKTSSSTRSRDFLHPDDALRRPRPSSHERPRAVSFTNPLVQQPLPPLPQQQQQAPRYPAYMSHAPHLSPPQPHVQLVPFPVPVPVPVPASSMHTLPPPPAYGMANSYNQAIGGYDRRPMMIRRSSSWAHLRRDDPRVDYDPARRHAVVGMPFPR